MTSKRPLILMLVLLVLLAGYVTHDYVIDYATQRWEMYKNPPLPGENRVDNIKLVKQDDSNWIATYDYYYTGYPQYARVGFFVDQRTLPEQKTDVRMPLYDRPAERGQHSVKIVVQNPTWPIQRAWMDAFTAEMKVVGSAAPFASARVAQAIVWDDAETLAQRPDVVMANATALIDNPHAVNLESARTMLEGLLAREPNFEPAYLELARVVMKTNWSAEGLHQAETLIGSALQIHADSTEAQILLAYVYAHQKRFKEAEALMAEVDRMGTTNLWFLANRGELDQMQGHDDDAIAAYRKLLQTPPTHDRNDRARDWTYSMLTKLLVARKDWDAVGSLAQQQVKDYPGDTCAATHYGYVLVTQRGDAETAIQLLRTSSGGGCGCSCENLTSTQVLGMAWYLKWSGAAEPERAEALRQARAFLPTGALTMYILAQADRTAAVAKQLVGVGDSLSAQDAEHFDALTLALQRGDHDAAMRLLKIGARTNTIVGEKQLPVAMVPVVLQDVEGVQLLRRAGVDYGHVEFRGVSASTIARRMGNAPLLHAMAPKAETL